MPENPDSNYRQEVIIGDEVYREFSVDDEENEEDDEDYSRFEIPHDECQKLKNLAETGFECYSSEQSETSAQAIEVGAFAANDFAMDSFS
jgi:hypothetical protein